MNATASWPRWIKATFTRELTAWAAERQLPLCVRFVHDRSAEFMSARHRLEVTFSGPHTRELSPKYHRIWFDVHCVLTSLTGGVENVGVHDDHSGALARVLDHAYEVKQYEPNAVEPFAHVGYLTPRRDKGDAITNNPDKAKDADPLRTSIVEARFEGFFTQ